MGKKLMFGAMAILILGGLTPLGVIIANPAVITILAAALGIGFILNFIGL